MKHGNEQMGIRKYRKITIFEHWLFSVTTLVLIITGMPFAFLWLFDLCAIFPIVKTDKRILAMFSNLHPYFGFLFIPISLFHVLIHLYYAKEDKEGKGFWFLNSYENRLFSRDFRALMHSLGYLLGFSNRIEHTSEKFNGYSRANYLSLIFAIVPIVFSGIVLWLKVLVPSLYNQVNQVYELAYVTHILFGTFLFLIVTYHILLKLRALDPIPFASIFLGREIPYWYARKYCKAWYKAWYESWYLSWQNQQHELYSNKHDDVKDVNKSSAEGKASSYEIERAINSILRSIYPESTDENLKAIASILSRYVDRNEDDEIIKLESVVGGNT